MIGKRLKHLRQGKKLLQKELAEKLKLTQQTISLYESNSRQPDYVTLEKIANFFEVTTDYLLGRTNQKYFSQDETIAFHAKGDLNEEDQKMVRDLIDRLVKDHKGTDK